MKKQAKKITKKPPMTKKAVSKNLSVKKRRSAVVVRKPISKKNRLPVKAKKHITKKRLKIFKPLGLFVVIMGALGLVSLISFAIAGFFSATDNTDTPVLGASTGLMVPTGFKAKVVNYSVMLSWDNMTDGQYQYVIWVYDSGIKKYNPEVIVDGKGTIGDIITKTYDQKPGTTLLYKVSMCEGCQFSEYHKIIGNSGGLSAGSVVTVPRVRTPSSLRLSNVSSGIKLTWSQIPGVDGFNIYRSSSFFGNYEIIGSVGTDGTYSSWHTMTDGVYDVPVDVPSPTTFTDTTVVPGVVYFYRVSAKKMINLLTDKKDWINIESSRSGFKSIRAAKLATPRGFSVKAAATDRLTIYAGKINISSTEGYYLYCDKCDTTKMKLLPSASPDIQFGSAKTDKNTVAFSLGSLKEKIRYGLWLTRYKVMDGKIYESAKTSTVYARTAGVRSPVAPVDFQLFDYIENQGISFSWKVPDVAVSEYNMLIECDYNESEDKPVWVGKPVPYKISGESSKNMVDSYIFDIDDFSNSRGKCTASLSAYDSKTRQYSEAATVTFKDKNIK